MRNRAASGAPGQQLVAELKRQLAEVGAHRLAGGNAEVGEPMHVVEDVLARVVLRPAGEVLHVADVRVRVDERGNDRLAGQIDARRTRRRLQVALLADAREPVVLDDEGGAFDWPRPSPVISLAPSKSVIAAACGGLSAADAPTAQLTRRTETALLMSVSTSEWTRYYAAQAVTYGGGRSVPSLKR